LILVPLIDLKFLKRACGRWCRNFKSAAPDPGNSQPRVTAEKQKKKSIAERTHSPAEMAQADPKRAWMPGHARASRRSL
jgi:Sec-independent protein translocase protein TatA